MVTKEPLVLLDPHRDPFAAGVARGQPPREVARTLMLARRLVNPIGIRPNPEVADVKHPREADAERLLERQHVLVHAVDRTVNVAGSAENHVRLGETHARPPV